MHWFEQEMRRQVNALFAAVARLRPARMNKMQLGSNLRCFADSADSGQTNLGGECLRAKNKIRETALKRLDQCTNKVLAVTHPAA